jgi:hypothetical protein
VHFTIKGDRSVIWHDLENTNPALFSPNLEPN